MIKSDLQPPQGDTLGAPGTGAQHKRIKQETLKHLQGCMGCCKVRRFGKIAGTNLAHSRHAETHTKVAAPSGGQALASLCRRTANWCNQMIALLTERTLTIDKGTTMDGNSRFHASKRLAATVAILTIGFGLATPPQSYGAGVWTNEPAGASVVLDCPFNGPPSSCGVLDAYSSSQITSDSSAPISPSSAVQSTFYAGNSSGGMQLNWSAPQISNEMYVGLMWRTNPQFQGRPVGNKMFFIRGPQTNGVFLFNNAALNNGSGPMIWGHNSSSVDNSHVCAFDLGLICYPNVGPGVLTVGVWTKLEAYIKKSTTATSRDGIVRWWVNGVPAGNYTNINYAPNGLNEWVWSETWDGTVNPVPTVDWNHFIDHLHISIPGGSNSADQPPGPPASPILRSVTTP